MKPVEFVIWLAGAMEIFGEDNPPDSVAWKKMYEKMGAAMGYIGAKKILEEAEKNVYKQEQAEKQMDMFTQMQSGYKGSGTSTGILHTGTGLTFAPTTTDATSTACIGTIGDAMYLQSGTSSLTLTPELIEKLNNL